MNRWWGSKADSDQQTSERNQRAARRTIAALPAVLSDTEDDYHDCNLSNSFLNVDGEAGEVDIMPDPAPAVFQDEAGTDDPDYYKKLGTLKNRMFNPAQAEFWFTSIETSLRHMGIKSQWSKREVLHSLLSDDIQAEVIHILKKDQTSAGTHPYRDLKKELLKLYAPKPAAAFQTALARTLISCGNKPSALAKAIINDICTCDPPLNSTCCQKIEKFILF